MVRKYPIFSLIEKRPGNIYAGSFWGESVSISDNILISRIKFLT